VVDREGRPRRLLDQVRDKLRTLHYSPRMEDAYVGWIKRFIFFHGKQHPKDLGAPEVEGFLSSLATQRGVSASTQNQALSALLFLNKQVLSTDIGWVDGVTRAKRPERVPVVLTRQEVASVLQQMRGRDWVMASLMYGTGLRLMECVQLRVQDIDFGYRQITVHNGKGAKDRFVPLPDALMPSLQEQIRGSERLLASDLAAGFGEVSMPESLVRKYPSGTTSIPRRFRRRCARRYGGRVSPSGRRPIPCATVSRPTSSRRATTSEPCKN